MSETKPAAGCNTGSYETIYILTQIYDQDPVQLGEWLIVNIHCELKIARDI